MNYKVVVCHRNSNWIVDCLDSIASQKYDNYEVMVVDDASEKQCSDAGLKTCIEYGFRYHRNIEQMGAMYNQNLAINALCSDDEDVIVIVDGDDTLAHDNVFSVLDEYYSKGVDMTWGNYRNVPDTNVKSSAGRFPDRIVRENAYRKYGQLMTNHLRTFKFKLFKHIDPEKEFKTPDGQWFQACCDTAIMTPCLELSGGRHVFIEDVLYNYNSQNPTSDWRRHAKEVDRIHHYILRELKPHKPLRTRR